MIFVLIIVFAGTVGDISSQIRNGFMEANAGQGPGSSRAIDMRR